MKKFPTLTITPSNPVPGGQVTLEYNGTSDKDFLVLFTALTLYPLPITNGMATLPANLTGQVYGLVSNNGTIVTDDTVVAGPAVLVFADPYNMTLNEAMLG